MFLTHRNTIPDRASARPPQPLSQRALEKAPRTVGATVTESVCPYCAVGCGLLVYTKAGKIIDIEGNPRSPINEGTLCPKGANSFQLAVNPHRTTHVLYRAPYSDHWEERPLEWAMDRIAQRVMEARDAETAEREKGTAKRRGGERERTAVGGVGDVSGADGVTVDHDHEHEHDSGPAPYTVHPMPGIKSFGTLGGATLDIEENYLIKKLFGAGLGVLSIENQARI